MSMLNKLFFCALISSDMLFVSAVKDAFCNDLVPAPLSLLEVETRFPMFGNTDNSLELILAEAKPDNLEEVWKDFCVSDPCSSNRDCTSVMRDAFYEYAIGNFANNTLELIALVKKENYMAYRSKEEEGEESGFRALFELSCIIMCQYMLKIGASNAFQCMCPNPCKFQTDCPEESCKSSGVFQHQYECTCTDGTWDRELHTCVPSNWKELRENPIKNDTEYDPTGCNGAAHCDRQGTLFCTTDATGQVFQCICKPQYSGPECAELIDACSTRITNPLLPGTAVAVAGDTACNVNLDGNRCISYLSAESDLSYRCNCNENFWGPKPELGYDNCLRKRTLCSSVLCVHGKCVPNERGTQAYCLCNPGYTGPACTEWVGEWTEWSPWDKCHPACGDVRYAVRVRDCLSMRPEAVEKRECLGASIEYAACAEHTCARTEGTFINTYFAIRQSSIATSISAAAIACTLITGTWALFAWGAIGNLVININRKLQKKRGHVVKSKQAAPEDASADEMKDSEVHGR